MHDRHWLTWFGIFAAVAVGCSGSEDASGSSFTGVPVTMTAPSSQSETGAPDSSSGSETGATGSTGGVSASATSSPDPTSSGGTSSSTGDASSSTGDVSTSTGDVSSTSTGDVSSSSGGSSTTGVAQVCGDGLVTAPEVCDDADKDNTDDCLDTCVAASCGDKFLHAGIEACDGNPVVNGACAADCKLACNATFGDCNAMAGDGCEVSLNSDLKNCGKCGNVCPANQQCQAGTCKGVANEFGPEHMFSGLQSNHFITQGCCSVGCAQNQAADADYFCKRFYGANCTAKAGWFQAQTPFPNYPKMHKRDGCTGNGLDIANTMCDGGPCKIGDWNENTTGLTNLVCVCV